jgi:chromosome segregation ATPase
MLHSNKIIKKSLFIIVVLLFSMLEAAAENLPEQIVQLEKQMVNTNKKIATLSLEQQKNSALMRELQASLSKAHQDINDLNNSREYKTHLAYAVTAGVHRTANGHGR